MHKHLVDYYRCREQHVKVALSGPLLNEDSYFMFGKFGPYYGQIWGGKSAADPNGCLSDLMSQVRAQDGGTCLPFDLGQIADNLRFELYINGTYQEPSISQSKLKDCYYALRALLPDAFRKRLQKAHLSDWRRLTFPRWSVDRSVDRIAYASEEDGRLRFTIDT